MRIFMLLVLLTFYSSSSFAQGTDCSNSIPIPMNGMSNNYSTSSSSGANVLCANNGNTPITWFSFTTNASGESPLLNITSSDGQPCEIAMYTGCGGNMNNNLETGSSMCFDDGTGLWAPAHNYSLSGNTTYYLRIKTSTPTTLQISAMGYTPLNNSCTGATPVDGDLLTDNNATHKPGPGINPPDLCAASIENTAYYQYNVASTGTSIINISSISCDNGAGNNISGFQIGFFTGSCGSLTWLNPCFSGSGSFVQATTPVLAAGTKVYVAIDGFEGSNCQYNIQAINAITLSNGVTNFSAWKNKKENLLRWETNRSLTKFFEVERSIDGNSFTTIGRFANPTYKNKSFEFLDNNPPQKAWYRLKEILDNLEMRFSKTVRVIREEEIQPKLYLTRTSNLLTAEFNSDCDQKSELLIFNTYGQRVLSMTIYCQKGRNNFRADISILSSGNYFAVLQTKSQTFKASFSKLNR